MKIETQNVLSLIQPISEALLIRAAGATEAARQACRDWECGSDPRVELTWLNVRQDSSLLILMLTLPALSDLDLRLARNWISGGITDDHWYRSRYYQ